MSNAQATVERPPLPHMRPNFQEVRSANGKLLFEIDYRRMVIRIKTNGRFETVDLLSQLQLTSI